MTIPWSSLYCPSSDTGAIVVALRESLSALGYELYNPFGMMPGKAYHQSVKLFAAPPRQNWVRVLGTFDERQFAHLSRSGLCLYVTLDAAPITVYKDGERVETESALAAYVRDGRSADDLRRILAGEIVEIHEIPKSSSGGLPMNALPDDVRAMATQVDPKQAQKLFSRLSGDVLKKVSKDSAQLEGARALVSGGGEPDWNSAAGQQIRALMACLNVPDDWRDPDFTALRDAYPLYERRKRNPDARLYPGDDATMASVPNALDYVPVYGGIL